MPEEQDKLPKPLTDLPKADPDLPLPEKDLPLPEKEITAHATDPNTIVVKNENSKTRGNNHVLKFILLGILTALIIAGLIGAYALGKNSSSSQIVETQISASPTPNPTANWTTYEGENFRFMYPSSMKEYPAYERIGFPSQSKIMVGKPNSDSIITFETFDNNSSLTTTEWWNKNATALLSSQANMYSNGITYKIEDFDLSTVKYDNNEFLFAESKKGTGSQYFITNGKIIVNIRPGLLNINEKDKILSSFKFMSKNVLNNKINWKTYTGPNKVYSISYPSEWKIYNPGAKSGGVDEADFTSPDQPNQGYFIVQSWFENDGVTPTGSNVKILPNGYKYSVIRSGILEPNIPENVYSQTAYIYNPKGGYLYLVVNTPESEKDFLEKIASTVKFN